MTGPELTEEDIMLDDQDPMEAIRQIRRDEGVAEEDLPVRDTAVAETDILDHTPEKKDDGADELAALSTDDETGDEEESEEAKAASDAAAAADAAIEAADKAADAAAEHENLSDEEKAAKAEAKKAEDEDAGDDDTADAVVTHKFRANGQEFEFTEQEIKDQFETVFGQAMDYTKKMQKIAPYRKMISALEQEGVSQDALNLAIDALKGDKGALRKLMEDNNIDAYDLTDKGEESEVYNPKSYGKDETSLDIEEITRTIQNDKEFAITTNVIDEQWDGDSRKLIVENPGLITGLHNDIKTGLYDKVAPAAMKMKVLDGNTKSDIEYYMLAGEQLRLAMEAEAKLNEDAQGAEDKFDKASSEANDKRSATSTGARADSKGVVDYLDDNDEDFDAWYKKTMSA